MYQFNPAYLAPLVLIKKHFKDIWSQWLVQNTRIWLWRWNFILLRLGFVRKQLSCSTVLCLLAQQYCLFPQIEAWKLLFSGPAIWGNAVLVFFTNSFIISCIDMYKVCNALMFIQPNMNITSISCKHTQIAMFCEVPSSQLKKLASDREGRM